MADLKISAMTAASALSGPELFAGVQSAANVKITGTQIKTWCSASPTLVTPALGVAAGTSLALGGATIGTDALGVTGTASISGTLLTGQLVQIGGSSSSFPALRQNSTVLQARLADNSGYTTVEANTFAAAPDASLTAGGTATRMRFIASSVTNFGIFFGSGPPTISAAKGSLYLRSDGTTTNDRAYINSSGSTTWTALTTAA